MRDDPPETESLYEISECREPIASSAHSKSRRSFQLNPPTSRPIVATGRKVHTPIPSILLRSTKRLNYPGSTDLPRGRATDNKSDCSDGISIRGRLYAYSTVYLVAPLDVRSRHIGRLASSNQRARGREGSGSDEYIRLKLIGIVPRLISRSWWFVAASDRR